MSIFPNKAENAPRNPNERLVIVLSLIVLLVLVVLDQVTKELVVAKIPYQSYTPVLPGFFDISHVTNKGAAWGMFHDSPWLPFSISIAAFIAIIVFIRKLTDGWPERFIAMAMILAGILGNSIDRLHYGAVIDFLRFHWRDAAEWPSFNVADSAIVCGVVIYAISSLMRPEKRAEADDADKPAEDAPVTEMDSKQ